MIDLGKLKAEIIAEEGFQPHVYLDHLTYQTIGYGRCVDRRKGAGISREEGEFLLENDMGRVLIALRARIKDFDKLPPGVGRALVHMAYQMGVEGLLGFRKMLAALEGGNYAVAEKEALDSTWAAQTPERARRVAAMIGAGE